MVSINPSFAHIAAIDTSSISQAGPQQAVFAEKIAQAKAETPAQANVDSFKKVLGSEESTRFEASNNEATFNISVTHIPAYKPEKTLIEKPSGVDKEIIDTATSNNPELTPKNPRDNEHYMLNITVKPSDETKNAARIFAYFSPKGEQITNIRTTGETDTAITDAYLQQALKLIDQHAESAGQ